MLYGFCIGVSIFGTTDARTLPDFRNNSPAALWPSVSSDVQSMTWKLAVENATVIGQMFDSLTLPLLENLSLTPCRDNPPPVWPPDAFLALADRSAFANHLTRLQIHAIATGDAVLRYLGVLSQLAELVIWDTPGADVVMTDTLLQGLIYTSDATGILQPLFPGPNIPSHYIVSMDSRRCWWSTLRDYACGA